MNEQTDHEINVAVAQVLGYHALIRKSPREADLAGWRLVNKDGVAVRPDHDNYSYHQSRKTVWRDVPDFVNDMTAAWEAMGWLRERDCDVSLGSAGTAWCVQHPMLDRWYGPLCERPGEAICQALILISAQQPKASLQPV